MNANLSSLNKDLEEVNEEIKFLYSKLDKEQDRRKLLEKRLRDLAKFTAKQNQNFSWRGDRPLYRKAISYYAKERNIIVRLLPRLLSRRNVIKERIIKKTGHRNRILIEIEQLNKENNK